MTKILVFCEITGNKIKTGSLELLSAAKNSGAEVLAVLVGSHASETAPMAALYGSCQTHICAHKNLDHYNPELFAATLTPLLQKVAAPIVLASSTVLARDLFPRLGARLDTGIISDCTQLKISGDSVSVRRPMYAGKCSAEVNFLNSAMKIILMRPNQLPINEPDISATAEIKEFPIAQVDVKTQLKEIITGASEKVDLTEANIIISGGRGMRNAENFKLLHELADTIGATVGASRAVCDAGWVPHSMQVGQTGKTVTPNLYIACGISGAIQHLAGMSGSKIIVAINKDPKAPIFQKATYGIVGDVFEVLPQLTKEFKNLLH